MRTILACMATLVVAAQNARASHDCGGWCLFGTGHPVFMHTRAYLRDPQRPDGQFKNEEEARRFIEDQASPKTD
jgi:hypothetical protein